MLYRVIRNTRVLSITIVNYQINTNIFWVLTYLTQKVLIELLPYVTWRYGVEMNWKQYIQMYVSHFISSYTTVTTDNDKYWSSLYEVLRPLEFGSVLWSVETTWVWLGFIKFWDHLSLAWFYKVLRPLEFGLGFMKFWDHLSWLCFIKFWDHLSLARFYKVLRPLEFGSVYKVLRPLEFGSVL